MATEADKAVGEALRAARDRADLKQAEVAEQMTLHGFPMQQQTILKIEKGQRSLRFVEAVALSEILGTPLSRFYEPSEERKELARAERRAADGVKALREAARQYNVAKRELEAFQRLVAEMPASLRARLHKWTVVYQEIPFDHLFERSVSFPGHQASEVDD